MPDPFASSADSVSSPAEDAAALVPHDTNPVVTTPKALYVGTGGHITGCAQVLKAKWPQLQVFAVEPTAQGDGIGSKILAEAERRADGDKRDSLTKHEALDIARIGAKRHADADFTGALCDPVADDAVKPESGQSQRTGAKDGEGNCHHAARQQRFGDNLLHGARFDDGQLSIHAPDCRA